MDELVLAAVRPVLLDHPGHVRLTAADFNLARRIDEIATAHQAEPFDA